MINVIYEIFGTIGKFGSIFVAAIAGISDIWAIVKIFKTRKITFMLLIVLLSSIVLFSSIYSFFLTEVPDLVGHTLEVAYNQLADANLKYELISGNGKYVIDQSIKAGKIVRIGTIIDVEVADISSNDNVIKGFEDEIDAEYGTVELTFYDIEVQFWNKDGVERCFGSTLEEITVSEAYLYYSEKDIKYCKYIIENGKIIFDRVPIGYQFTLLVALDGFEEQTNIQFCLSSQNMENKVFKLNIGMMRKNREFGLANSFRIADSKGNFLADVKTQIKWGFSDIRYGDYKTDEYGQLEEMIWTYKDQVANICISNPFDINGNEYYVDIPIRKYVAGDSGIDIVIILKEDGTYRTVSESEYFGY